ncbi:hypothetical protein EMIT0P2_210006 [Pseudomonas sp. IT-P2]|uniref:phage tail protein n=1 Tax=Pseudomonas sp. IT-P2 TaxID=3026456 RepID=UPI0039DF470E
MPWYKAGTVSVVQNSNAVIGTGTEFIAGCRVGDAFRGPDAGWYEIIGIGSDTTISISPNYQGATNAAGVYALAPMQGYVKDSADALRALLQQFGGVLSVLGDVPTQAGVRSSLNLASTDGLLEGATNKYMSGAGVRAIPLTGLDLTQATAVVATDTILAAFGKLQASKADVVDVKKVVVSVSSSRALLPEELGLVLASASVAATTITLPAATSALGVRDVVLRRVDNSGNRLTIQANGTDKIKFHTHLSSAGYAFFVLMGAGDFWHLRSDGAGSWWPIARADTTPLGRPSFETTTTFPPGGYGGLAGPVLQRSEWPWLWDHAQASGMLTTEAARVGREGGWTSGDGSATFRGPEGRGEFIRILDETRGVDISRVAGSSQGDAIRNITGSVSALYRPAAAGSSGAMGITQYGSTPPKAGSVGADPGDSASVNFDASRQVPTATENRPRNIAWPGRIKMI